MLATQKLLSLWGLFSLLLFLEGSNHLRLLGSTMVSILCLPFL